MQDLKLFKSLDNSLCRLAHSDLLIKLTPNLRDDFDSIVDDLNKIKKYNNILCEDSDFYFINQPDGLNMVGVDVCTNWMCSNPMKTIKSNCHVEHRYNDEKDVYEFLHYLYKEWTPLKSFSIFNDHNWSKTEEHIEIISVDVCETEGDSCVEDNCK